jgi:hypothetical protein
MTRVIWDDDGERLYHAGVDRGMLYVGSDIPLAVAWPGLIAVTEAPEIADAQPFYTDGDKILDIPSSEDYAGTIEVVSYPPEFAPCVGRNRLSNGLYAADQPHCTFGFSYRTLIGNDLQGTDYAYKLHMVYNATAQSTGFTRATINDGRAPSSVAWSITTFPQVAYGIRPTAHVIFDTRVVSSDAISGAEAILYGDDDDDPRIPTLAELITLLAS